MRKRNKQDNKNNLVAVRDLLESKCVKYNVLVHDLVNIDKYRLQRDIFINRLLIMRNMGIPFTEEKDVKNIYDMNYHDYLEKYNNFIFDAVGVLSSVDPYSISLGIEVLI